MKEQVSDFDLCRLISLTAKQPYPVIIIQSQTVRFFCLFFLSYRLFLLPDNYNQVYEQPPNGLPPLPLPSASFLFPMSAC